MAMLLFVQSLLWRIIGDSGFVVSSVVPSAQALLSFHLLTGKREHAPVTPAWSQAQRTHVKALPLTGREATMPFLARIMAAQRHRRGRYTLALCEQKRLILFDLDDILATGLMNLGRRGGIAVMRIQGHFARLKLGVL